MTWSKDKAFEKLQEIYTDRVMQDEKRRIFQQVYRHLHEHLEDLAVTNGLKEEAEKQLKFFKEYTFMPGDNLFQSMRYVFLLARGERETNPQETQQHLSRIYEALFQPAGLKNPYIPDSFWETPLGVACLIAEEGIEAVYPILDEILEAESAY
jgi:recombinational DNA repair protein (RecF pathway)